MEYEGEFLYAYKYNGKGYDENGKVIYELINGKGKVKEYFIDGSLRFEGEYLNGKRHGIGREYGMFGLEFEGEYLNGKRNGKGKEYQSSSLVSFEGEYLNGKRNGKGKEYKGGKVIFEGEYLNDQRSGKGKEYNKYGVLIFEGEYLDDQRNGKGKEYGAVGELIFEGEYQNGHKIRGDGLDIYYLEEDDIYY